MQKNGCWQYNLGIVDVEEQPSGWKMWIISKCNLLCIFCIISGFVFSLFFLCLDSVCLVSFLVVISSKLLRTLKSFRVFLQTLLLVREADLKQRDNVVNSFGYLLIISYLLLKLERSHHLFRWICHQLLYLNLVWVKQQKDTVKPFLVQYLGGLYMQKCRFLNTIMYSL